MKFSERHLIEQIAKGSEGNLSPEEAADLDALLLENPEARKVYLRTVQMHSLLESCPPEVIVPTGRTIRFSQSSWIAGLAVAAAVAVLALAANLFLKTDTPSPIATLILAEECQWSRSADSPVEGQRLSAGNLYLTRGTAVIRFDNGAEMVIAKGTSIALISADSARLESGEVVIRAEAGSEGFRLDSPGGEMTDLGTEFAVRVRRGGETELHVHEGEVATERSVVVAGEAVKLEKSGSSEVPLDAPRFRETIRKANPKERRDLMTAYEGFFVDEGVYDPGKLDSGKGWAGPWRLRGPSELLHHVPDSTSKMHIAHNRMDVAWPIKGGQLGMLEMPEGNTVRIRQMKEPIAMNEEGIRYFSFLVTEPLAVAEVKEDGRLGRLDMRLTLRSSADYDGEALSFGWERKQFPRIGVKGGANFRSTRRVPDGETVFCVGKIISSKRGEDEVSFRLYTAKDELDLVEPAEWDVTTRDLRQSAEYDLVLITSVASKPRYLDEIRIGPTWRSVTPIAQAEPLEISRNDSTGSSHRSNTIESNGASVRETHLDSFMEKHCYECHDDLSSEGDLNLLDLALSPEDPENLAQWITVLDRVRSGEMPPKEEPRPSQEDADAFLTALGQPLVEADEKRIAESGRGRIRRLNRSEYETALSDLFDIPLRVRGDLPEDAKSHGFDTVGEALNVSAVQMEAYLEVLDKVLDQATTLYPEPARRKHRLTYREENGIMQVYRKGGPFHIQDDGVAFFATEKFSHLNACLSQYTAPHSAKYRVKVSAYALRSEEPVILSLRAGGIGHAESNHVPHVFLKHMPVEEGEPQVFEWEGWLERGHYFHVYPTSLPPMRFEGKNEEMRQHEYEGPAAVVQWVEVDGPIFEEWPPASHRALWGEMETEKIPHADPNKDPIEHLDKAPAKIAQPRMTRKAADKASGNKFIYDPKKQKAGGERIHRAAPKPDSLRSTLQLVSSDPKKDSVKLIRDFADRAFRRKVDEEEVAPITGLVHRWLDEGRDFESAMRVGYKALLTSPGFLYHQGSLPDDSPVLSDDALAERLSFFLWNGLPDDELRIAAGKGLIGNSGELRRQTERLLSDPKSERFLTEFLGLWLDLRLIDFTVPDEKLYPEFDKLLQWSMLEETKGFVRKLVTDDLPASHVIDSDFAMVNWRLASHYGLPPVDGMEVRPVALPDDSIRGGLMTQGSVLKVTANGTTTSPVVRGTWVMERIMGITPKPPPPGIPAIEPDIRGATTVREQLEKHRAAKSCAACHAEIDPPGLALENFDVIGGWRDHYRALNEELADVREKYSWKRKTPIRYVEGPVVDASYVTAAGQAFDDINDFKGILLQDPRQIARGIVGKLVIYSTGAEISLADRKEIEAILDRAEPSGFGFRTLIHEVVQSPLFARK